MHFDNTVTDHNRTVKVTGLPNGVHRVGGPSSNELLVTIGYVSPNGDYGSRSCAVELDRVIIPTLIAAGNAFEELPEVRRGAELLIRSGESTSRVLGVVLDKLREWDARRLACLTAH